MKALYIILLFLSSYILAADQCYDEVSTVEQFWGNYCSAEYTCFTPILQYLFNNSIDDVNAPNQGSILDVNFTSSQDPGFFVDGGEYYTKKGEIDDPTNKINTTQYNKMFFEIDFEYNSLFRFYIYNLDIKVQKSPYFSITIDDGQSHNFRCLNCYRENEPIQHLMIFFNDFSIHVYMNGEIIFASNELQIDYSNNRPFYTPTNSNNKIFRILMLGGNFIQHTIVNELYHDGDGYTIMYGTDDICQYSSNSTEVVLYNDDIFFYMLNETYINTQLILELLQNLELENCNLTHVVQLLNHLISITDFETVIELLDQLIIEVNNDTTEIIKTLEVMIDNHHLIILMLNYTSMTTKAILNFIQALDRSGCNMTHVIGLLNHLIDITDFETVVELLNEFTIPHENHTAEIIHMLESVIQNHHLFILMLNYTSMTTTAILNFLESLEVSGCNTTKVIMSLTNILEISVSDFESLITTINLLSNKCKNDTRLLISMIQSLLDNGTTDLILVYVKSMFATMSTWWILLILFVALIAISLMICGIIWAVFMYRTYYQYEDINTKQKMSLLYKFK